MDEPLTARMERLLDAYAGHGLDVRGHLKPGAPDEAITAVGNAIGIEVPDEVRQLYRWTAGPTIEYGDELLTFRDNSLLPLSEVAAIHALVVQIYGSDLTPEEERDEYGFEVRHCVPFAHFEGATYGVLAGAHRLEGVGPHPVISIYHGAGAYYDSLSALVDTCVAWVSHPDWELYATPPDEEATWRRHNPAITPHLF